MRLNRVQAKAVYQLYKGNPDGSPGTVWNFVCERAVNTIRPVPW